MKCERCGEIIDEPEIKNGSIYCDKCGAEIGRVAYDTQSIEMK